MSHPLLQSWKQHGYAGLAAGVLVLGLLIPNVKASVYLEDSPAALQLADEARDLQNQGKLGEAAQKLQEIVREFPDKLMPVDATGYTDARRWVRLRLLDSPDLLSAYRNRYGFEAGRALLQAAEVPAVPRSRREAQLLDILNNFPVTDAAIGAALQLAGLHLERGDPAGASAMLELISSLVTEPAHGRRYHQLRVWSAALSGDQAALATALEDVKPYLSVEELDSLTNSVEGIASAAATPVTGAEPMSPPPLGRPLWQVAIEPPAGNRLVVAQPRVAQNPSSATAELSPVVAGSMLLINDNRRVYALDRISGRLRWAYRHEETDGQKNPAGVSYGANRVVQDQRAVLVQGDGVYAVLGFAAPWQGRRRQFVHQPTQLVGLDRDSGSLRWSVTPGQLDASLERAAFHGTPVACGDQIIVMARRSQASSFQDTYLFSVDAATGELRWRRHLASTAGPNRRNALPPMSSMTIDGDAIYLCDNLGAAAAIDARTGGVRWVRVLLDQRVDERGRPQGVAIPFSQASQPAVCSAGVVIPMRVNEARGLLLDPATGAILERFDSRSAFGDAYEIRTLDNGDLLVIGQELVRLAGDSLEPRWSTAITPPNVEGITPRVSLRPGVAMVARESNQLQEFDLGSGQLIAEHRLPWNGKVIATADAWVVTTERRLGGYLDWSLAYDTLQQRAETDPLSPEPGLNIAMLAINAGQPDAVDEGVDRALSALAGDMTRREQNYEAWAEDRGEVFEELLSLTERDDAIEPAVIERLFNRLALTTETPAELLACNLARGDFLVARNRLAEAVEFYQAVLLDPQQAGESLVRGDVTRRGDIAARVRLVRLAESNDPAFYERFERQAERELSLLLSNPAASVDELLGLARRYPLADISAEAVFAAAQGLSSSASPTGAGTQYRRAFQLADNDDLRARAAGGLATHYENLERPNAAARWLEQVVRDRPGLQPVRLGVPVDPLPWIAALQAMPQADRRGPTVSPPFSATIRLPGRLVPPVDASAKLPRPGGVLITSNRAQSQVVFFDLERQQNRWTADDLSAGLRLVDQGRDNLVFWQPQTLELICLDAATGRSLWPAMSVMPLLDDLGEGGLAQSRRANAGGLLSVIEADFGPINRNNAPNALSGTPPNVLAGEAVACVVDAKGRAFGLDRTNGMVLWQSALPVDNVTHAKVVDDVLAVAGLVSPGTEAQSGRVMLIDLATGRLRFPPLEDTDPASRIYFTPDGDLLALTRNQAMRYDRRDGGLRWRTDLGEFTGTPSTINAGDVLFVHDRNRLIALDLERGVIQSQTPNVLSRSTTLGVNLGRDGTLYSLTAEGSVAFDADLNIRWQDALASQPKKLLTQQLGERHLFVFEQYAGPDGPPGLRLSVLERETGRLIDHAMLDDLGQAGSLSTVQVLHDHLLVAGRSEVALIPGTPTPTPRP